MILGKVRKLMLSNSFFILLFFLLTSSCNNSYTIGKVEFIYLEPLDTKLRESLNPIEKGVLDSVSLRFMKDFDNEVVSISIGGRMYIEGISLKSDMSIGYATTIQIPVSKSYFVIGLRGAKYKIPYNKFYTFYDIYVDKNNVMIVEFNNNIIELSYNIIQPGGNVQNVACN